MAKKGMVTKSRFVERCMCSTCGQVSSAVAATVHFGCTGMPAGFFDRAPSLRGRVSKPDAKGTWQPVAKTEAA